MTETAAEPMFGPYQETVDGETGKKYLMVPPEDIAAIEKMLYGAAHSLLDTSDRIVKLQALSAQTIKLQKQNISELEALFDRQWKRDQEAIKYAQEKGLCDDLTWPDRGCLVIFLMEQLDQYRKGALPWPWVHITKKPDMEQFDTHENWFLFYCENTSTYDLAEIDLKSIDAWDKGVTAGNTHYIILSELPAARPLKQPAAMPILDKLQPKQAE